MDDYFPRQFRFQLPLFDTGSPWRVFAGKPSDTSRQQAERTFAILREYSEKRLVERKEERDQLLQQGQPVPEKLTRSIERAEQALLDGGGLSLFPFVNYDDFSFPIYPVRRINGRIATSDVPLRPYASAFFEPPWFPAVETK